MNDAYPGSDRRRMKSFSLLNLTPLWRGFPLQPGRIPKRVVTDMLDQPRPQRISNDIARNFNKIFLSALRGHGIRFAKTPPAHDERD